MAKNSPLVTTPLSSVPHLTYWAAKGIYQKVIGRVATEWEGEGYDTRIVASVTKKFYFGSDLAKAQVAAARVTQLFDEMRLASVQYWEPFYS